MSLPTSTLGFPRVGGRRELKAALEKHWAGNLSEAELLSVRDSVLAEAVRIQGGAGVSCIGVGDSTLYDHVLDWNVRFGLTSKRFASAGAPGTLANYFAQAKGAGDCTALQLLKYFDTNYHILVPEIDAGVAAEVAKPSHATFFADYVHVVKHAQQVAAGLPQQPKCVPIVLGPVTFAHLSKIAGTDTAETLAEALVPLYARLFKELEAAGGVSDVQIHEPWLGTSGADEASVLNTTKRIHEQLAAAAASCSIAVNLCVHHESVSEAVYTTLVSIEGVATVTLDLCRSKGAIEVLQKVGFPHATKRLGAGVVDGRSVWANDAHTRSLLARVLSVVPASRVDIAASCSLQHVPYDASVETFVVHKAGAVDVAASAALTERIAFAVQKVAQLVALSQNPPAASATATAVWAGEDNISVTSVAAAELTRSKAYEARRGNQVDLPALATSTIGSFPQTDAIRRARQQHRTGKMDAAAYRTFIEGVISENVGLQRDLGLDVFVHGEPERADMVEYFGERLEGMVITRLGWVQSYGSRCVRPPIIYADVVRRGALTVAEFAHAQKESGCTPVKGMLTGPVTILNWSFCRMDVPRSEQAMQLARAVSDEIRDLEDAGCRIVQVDEAAVRERMPLKASDSATYMRWAVDAFRLCTASARPETMVATHMCYSSFDDATTLRAIDEMDADVLLIENSRGGNTVLGALSDYGYGRDIGFGVYDVHSAEVPQVDVLVKRLSEIVDTTHLPTSRVWINPDCGLKTRRWEEVTPSLKNMVEATRIVRAECAQTS